MHHDEQTLVACVIAGSWQHSSPRIPNLFTSVGATISFTYADKMIWRINTVVCACCIELCFALLPNLMNSWHGVWQNALAKPYTTHPWSLGDVQQKKTKPQSSSSYGSSPADVSLRTRGAKMRTCEKLDTAIQSTNNKLPCN
jgi:hypothetical protein